MSKNDLKNRTFQFALSIISLIEKLPKSKTTDVIIYQIVKSGTSVRANYRAVLRSRSDKELEVSF